VDRRATGPVGAVVAGGVAVLVTVAGILIDISPPVGVVDFPFLGIGIPAAALIGALVGPSIRARGGVGSAVLAMATLTIAVADAFLVLGIWIAALFSGSSGSDFLAAIAGAVALWLIGLIVVGVPMLLVTTPCAFVWAWILRELTRRGHGVTVW